MSFRVFWRVCQDTPGYLHGVQPIHVSSTDMGGKLPDNVSGYLFRAAFLLLVDKTNQIWLVT